jgi:hypothetical protein
MDMRGSTSELDGSSKFEMSRTKPMKYWQEKLRNRAVLSAKVERRHGDRSLYDS